MGHLRAANYLHAFATHSQDLVLRLPPAASPEADKRLLRDAGRRAVTG